MNVDVLCCPACKGTLHAAGSSLACRGCGVSYEVLDGVANFLGRAVCTAPGRGHPQMAEWLIANRSLVSPSPDQLIDRGLSVEEAQQVIRSLPLAQVLNDLRHMLDGVPAPSETLDFMMSRAPVGSACRVLDVGCSVGRHLLELANCDLAWRAAVDTSLLSLLVGNKTCQLVESDHSVDWFCADAIRLPFQDRAFSHAHSFVTLSYVPIRRALLELARVLEPGGHLTITVEGYGFWHKSWEAAGQLSECLNMARWRLGNQLLAMGVDWQNVGLLRRAFGGCTQFSPETIAKLVADAGFRLEEVCVLRTHNSLPSLLAVAAERGATPQRGDNSIWSRRLKSASHLRASSGRCDSSAV